MTSLLSRLVSVTPFWKAAGALALGGVTALGAHQYHTSRQLEDKVDQYVQETLKEWDIPGISLAVVHKGEEVKVKGYGLRRRNRPEPVDADTLFQICSLTKAFTTFTVNELVKQDKLAWEKPIKGYLPDFTLKDPVATEEVTLRDLVSHRSGLPGIPQQAWRLWYQTNLSTKDLIYRLRFVEPAYPLRSHFAYDNTTYALASEVFSSVSGKPWQQFCQDKIFTPLGMTRTSLSYESLLKDNNVASAHLQRKIQEEPIKWLNWDSLAAAAGINSSARDMAQWLKFCLESPSIAELQTPQTLCEVEGIVGEKFKSLWPLCVHDQHITNYGLGWMSYTLDNRVIFFHTGRSDGMQSVLVLIPDEQLGIVVLSNAGPQFGHICLLNTLIDHFLHKGEQNWHQKAKILLADVDRAEEIERITYEAKRNKDMPPSLPLKGYNGTYTHPAYGCIEIDLEGDSLSITTFNQERGELTPWRGDQFSAPVMGLTIDFELNADKSAVSGLRVPDLGFFARKDLSSKQNPR